METLVMFWDKPWQNSLPHGHLIRLIVLLSGIDPFHGTRTNTLYPQYYDTLFYDILSLFPNFQVQNSLHNMILMTLDNVTILDFPFVI